MPKSILNMICSIDSFLLFDINKFMTEEHLPQFHSQPQLPNPPKRKRIPSQYASQIADFKNNLTLPSKRAKSTKFLDSIEVPQQEHNCSSTKPLPCILPNGKKYSVRLVIGPNKQINGQNVGKRKMKKKESSGSIRCKQQKKQEVSMCLLDKFLSAFQNLQREQENKGQKQNNEISKQDVETKMVKREEKVRRQREKDQKWNKSYDKFVFFSNKLASLQETFTFLI